MKTNWLVVVVAVLVGTVVVQGQQLAGYGGGWGGNNSQLAGYPGSGYAGDWGGGGYSYGYQQRSGVEVSTPRSNVKVTGLAATWLMKPALLEVVSSNATPVSEHYSELPKTQLGIDVAEIAKRQRAEEATSKMAAENAKLKNELEVANAIKAQKAKELADLKKVMEENSLLRQELQKAQAKKK
jgi:hypothetical protein